MNSTLRHQNVTRYIAPLREGGSLPALAEADDGFKYVVKFLGAGHGSKALVSELIGGEIARLAGLRVPELVFLDIDEDFGRTEPDEEIQDLLKASRGLNLGLHFLSGAMTLDPYANPVSAVEASKILWVDAFLTNIDRTVKNTNMLLWHGETWLIDHGASLYFHHSWGDHIKAAMSPFPYSQNHAMLSRASMLNEVDAEMHRLITPEAIDSIVAMLPDEWLDYSPDTTPDEVRKVYSEFLKTRLNNSQLFVNQANEFRSKLPL